METLEFPCHGNYTVSKFPSTDRNGAKDPLWAARLNDREEDAVMHGAGHRCAPTRPASAGNRDREAHGAGRPRVLDVETRREAILDAASCALQQYGYHAASMDRVAKAAGMSKKTLYQWFDSKQSLYENLISDRLLTIKTPMDNAPGSIAEQLSRSLKALSREFMQTERLCLLRTVIAETRAPEIRQIVGQLFEMKCASFPLRTWLVEQRALNRIICEDIDEKTDLLFGMTLGLMTLGELTGGCANRTELEQDQLIDHAISVFLYGIDHRTSARNQIDTHALAHEDERNLTFAHRSHVTDIQETV
jgi:AcrR family transcriptional regulator